MGMWIKCVKSIQIWVKNQFCFRKWKLQIGSEEWRRKSQRNLRGVSGSHWIKVREFYGRKRSAHSSPGHGWEEEGQIGEYEASHQQAEMEGLLCAGHSASWRRPAFWRLERIVIILQECKIHRGRQDLRKPTVWMERAVSAWNHCWEIGIIESQEARGLWVPTSWMGKLCYLPGDVKMWSRIIMWLSKKESTVFCLVLSKWCMG